MVRVDDDAIHTELYTASQSVLFTQEACTHADPQPHTERHSMLAGSAAAAAAWRAGERHNHTYTVKKTSPSVPRRVRG